MRSTRVAEDTLDYVAARPDGARRRVLFGGGRRLARSARSAASQVRRSQVHPHKREGAFYVWTAAEIDALMGDDAPIVRRRFGIEEGGNALADPQGEFAA